MNKIIVLGLDGATWKVLGPLIKNNKLPYLKELTEKGTKGKLKSTFPPITGPAWLSMATGKNPGKTGVFNFIKKKDKDLEDDVINSTDFKNNNAYWDILNDHGYTTFLINHPLFYPFYEINGIIVGGMGLPEGANITYPPTLEKKLNDLTNGYWTRIDWHSSKYSNKKKFITNLRKLIEKQFKAVEYLINKEWDLFLHVNSATDYLQHVMWEDWRNSESRFHKDFIDIWKTIDKKLKTVLQKYPSTDTLIVSDHGFGECNRYVNLSKILQQNKLIRKNKYENVREVFKKILHSLYIKTRMSKHIQIDKIEIPRFLKEYLNIGTGFSSDINVKKSKLIPTSATMGIAGIHLNTENGDKDIVINRYKKYFKEELKKYDIKIDIMKPNHLYKGEKTESAPDFFIKSKNPMIEFKTHTLSKKVVMRDLPDNRTGSHRMNGIFIASGPNIRSTKGMKNFKIYDIAPTILHHYGVPIPNNLDGRVLKEIYKDDSELHKREIIYETIEEKEKIKDIAQNLKV